MPTRRARRSKPPRISPLANESLYVGIDVGKQEHVAGFVSTTLLRTHERFEGCPVLRFANSREGFQQFIDRIREYIPLDQCFVLFEQTGHYHKVLEYYLLELDLTVYRVHVQRRPAGILKTDKRDALRLAIQLYNQLERGVQIADKLHLARRAHPPTEAAAQLKGLTRHRYELAQESTQRRNKLTAICDELFPELTQIFRNPNLPTSLAFRELYPTPQAIATASLPALGALRMGNRPSEASLIHLQELARYSIGTKDLARQRGLVFEQGQLIKELRLISEHMELLDAEISQIVAQCREGQILTSIPGIGVLTAATMIATIGTIANFESAAALKSYFGWAPQITQSGTSLDRSRLTHGGVRTAKKMLYLAVWMAVRLDNNEWARLYQRLVPLKCTWDEATRRYKGRGKVIGRIAGQMIAMVFALLKADYELLSHLAPGARPPPPQGYDPEIHQRHQQGQYQALKPRERQQAIVQLSHH